MPNYAKRALRGVAITFIMSFLASVAAYGLRIYLARALGPRDLGLFYAVFTFVIFFLFFRGLGLAEALVKFIAEYRSRDEYGKIKSAIVTVTSLQIISSAILGLIFFLAADFLALNYFKDPQAAKILKWLIIYIFFSLLFIVMKSTFQGLQQMLLSSSMELVKNLLVLLLAIIFFSLGQGIFSAVWAYCLVCLILILGYLPFFLRSCYLLSCQKADFWPVAKKISLFSLPIFATAIANKVIAYIDTLFLTYFRPLTEVGVYNVVLNKVSI